MTLSRVQFTHLPVYYNYKQQNAESLTSLSHVVQEFLGSGVALSSLSLMGVICMLAPKKRRNIGQNVRVGQNCALHQQERVQTSGMTF